MSHLAALLIAAAAAIIGGFIGWWMAASGGLRVIPLPQGLTRLPHGYVMPFTPTYAEWLTVRLLAEYAESALTDRLILTRFHPLPSSAGYRHSPQEFIVYTRTQAAWEVYSDGSRFTCSDDEVKAAYEEAARRLIERLTSYYRDVWVTHVPGVWFQPTTELTQVALTIHFYILGPDLAATHVGTWQGSYDQGQFAFKEREDL